jgi:hypothetical protein
VRANGLVRCAAVIAFWSIRSPDAVRPPLPYREATQVSANADVDKQVIAKAAHTGRIIVSLSGGHPECVRCIKGEDRGSSTFDLSQ